MHYVEKCTNMKWVFLILPSYESQTDDFKLSLHLKKPRI